MEIMTFKEAAVFLRISERHLRELVKTSDIPHRQTGPKARVFFVKDRLIAWWDRASLPLPTELKVERFRLLRRKNVQDWQHQSFHHRGDR
jgi:excisionase family DNA binding protein